MWLWLRRYQPNTNWKCQRQCDNSATWWLSQCNPWQCSNENYTIWLPTLELMHVMSLNTLGPLCCENKDDFRNIVGTKAAPKCYQQYRFKTGQKCYQYQYSDDWPLILIKSKECYNTLWYITWFTNSKTGQRGKHQNWWKGKSVLSGSATVYQGISFLILNDYFL